MISLHRKNVILLQKPAAVVGVTIYLTSRQIAGAENGIYVRLSGQKSQGDLQKSAVTVDITNDPDSV